MNFRSLSGAMAVFFEEPGMSSLKAIPQQLESTRQMIFLFK